MINPSLALVPAGVSVNKVFAQIPDPAYALDYSRTGEGTRVNSQGLIEVVPENVPRRTYYYNGRLHKCPALLLEPAATNLLLHSEDFSNAVWEKTGISITPNASQSPDGSTTADKVIADNGVTGTLVQFVTLADSTIYAISIYADPAEVTTLSLGFVVKTGAEPGATFDLVNDTITNFASAPISAYIEQDINGFKRCVITVSSSSGGTSPRIRIYAPSTSSVGNAVNGYFLWGAQVEANTVSTSYIPTTTVAKLRGLSVCDRTSASSVIGQTEGTLFAKVSINIKAEPGTPVAPIIALNVNAANFNDCIVFGINRGATNQIYAFGQVSNVTQFIVDSPNISNGIYKVALVYKQNDFSLFINGNLVDSANSGNVAALSQILFSPRFNSDVFALNDCLIKSEIYAARISNEDVIELTSWNSYEELADALNYTL